LRTKSQRIEIRGNHNGVLKLLHTTAVDRTFRGIRITHRAVSSEVPYIKWNFIIIVDNFYVQLLRLYCTEGPAEKFPKWNRGMYTLSGRHLNRTVHFLNRFLWKWCPSNDLISNKIRTEFRTKSRSLSEFRSKRRNNKKPLDDNVHRIILSLRLSSRCVDVILGHKKKTKS